MSNQNTKYNLSDADSTLKLADELRKFIKENKLWLDVHGKPHINIEAWQYAAANLGIVPVVERVDYLSTGDEIKYGAFVTLYQTGEWQKVSAGYAVCSNKELGKKSNPEFAICSMAQTRAEGKAYRLLLGWLIKAAGYEATPSEEMDSLGIETSQAANKPHVPTKAPVKAAEGPTPNPAEGSHHEPKVSANPVSPATVEQKNELIRQLNNPSITNAERTKTLSLIGKMNSEKVEDAILKVKKTIAERAMKAGAQKHVKA